tara:strand:- start:69 stop:275 length:207 start_codon:yes stop_codon:yes gene_type:complete
MHYEEKENEYDIVCLLRKLGHTVMKTPTKKERGKYLHNVDGYDMTTYAMRKFLYERVDGIRNSLGKLT